uniref:Uncharacterized protein n=1 Tax=Amphimedon queenslandica TaxID=400682 RepID=A0A1X7UYN8_AMPQE
MNLLTPYAFKYVSRQLELTAKFEKFNHTSRITTKLPSLASEEIGSVFRQRTAVLQKLVSAWECEKEVHVTDCILSSDDDNDKDDMLDAAVKVPPLQIQQEIEVDIENQYEENSTDGVQYALNKTPSSPSLL